MTTTEVLEKRQEVLDAAASFQLHRRSLLEAWQDGRAPGVRVAASEPHLNEQMMREARRWRHLQSIRPTAHAEDLRVSLPGNRAMVSKGLQMLSIWDGEALGATELAMLAAEPVGDYRVSLCPVQMKIIDGVDVYLQGPAGPAGISVLAVRRPDTMELAQRYWRSVMALAEPVRPVEEAPEPFTSRQRQVIDLLVEGATDARIAHVLGVSLRTVRSETAVIMSTLGVRSRFAAGHVLGSLAGTDEVPAGFR